MPVTKTISRNRLGAALVPLLFGALITACGAPPAEDEAPANAGAPPADLILVGEHILTMDGSEVDAVAVTGKTITATGSAADILAYRGEATRLIELGDRALLPGFVDAHSHVMFVGATTGFSNLASPPVGEVETIADLISALKTRIEAEAIPEGEWVIGYGYDDSLLAETRHPTRHDLDLVSTEHPIAILHVSGHLTVANSLGLALVDITEETPNPPGGQIRREDGGTVPNGVLEETATYALRGNMFSQAPEVIERQVRAALNVYAAEGFTTVQDGASPYMLVGALKAFAAQEPYPLDVVMFPVMTGALSCNRETMYDADYSNGIRTGGVKFVLDGSPQGRTAFLTEPYTLPPEGMAEDYRAYPAIERNFYNTKLGECFENGVPTLSHANGDAAIDMMLDGVETALSDLDEPLDHRAVIIHAQLIREDQLDRVAALGVVPSFYSAHPFFWGDWHKQIFGAERATRISPVRSAIARDIHFTIHNDAPVIPPMGMQLASITVNRKTRSGAVLGEDQRATPYEALYALTMGGAYQYFEEDVKGSITPGKQADLVILDTDPLAVDPALLGDVEVVETIAQGISVYTNPAFE